MAEIVNLRMARKSRVRRDAERSAEANRAKFGRGKDEKERQRLDTERAARQLDGARRKGTD